MSVAWIPYDGSWISIGAAATVACIVVAMAYASAIFYAPILWAAIRLNATRNMPPLPPGRIGIPYLGESLDYLRSWRNLLDLDVWYDTRYAKHGGIFTTHILGSPTVVMLGAQANKFVLINENKLFRNSWPKSFRVLIGEHAMVTSQGADHKRMRRIIHSIMGIETLKNSVGRFERLVLHHLDSDWRPGQIIHAHSKLREMTLCATAEYFLGLKAGEGLESFRRHFHHFNKGFLSHPLDLPWTAFGKAKRSRAAIVAQIAQLIHLRKTSLSKSGEEEENFLDMVLRTQKAGIDSCLSDEEIADNVMGFFTGG
ncbi:cytochrome P450 716B1-like [Cryptomeria japonica]|uniref:cytochrome P450 716B1-like n=1 Tax=Cryptomeria japonica TaxID=3369 RepID=UPI0027DA9F72|nr:cytochrome P450 716B1-like [Cryptomeria japonica]